MSEVIQGPLWAARNWSINDGAGSIHDDDTATELGFRGGTVAGDVHMNQFPPVLLKIFGNEWFDERILSSTYYFNEPEYKVVDSMDINRYRDFISNLPNQEKPNLFFLNQNADITFRKREGNDMLATIQLTMPKESDSGSGKSRDDIINEFVVDYLGKLPADYIETEVRDMIRKLGGPKGLERDKGFKVPLNICLFHPHQLL